MHILFPGRHLVNTQFQEEYLAKLFTSSFDDIQFDFQRPPSNLTTLDSVIFAITSANLDTCRYSPVPIGLRTQSVRGFAENLAQYGIMRTPIIAIPHFPNNPRFAKQVISEIYEQTEGELELTPKNTVVLSSTPSLSTLYANLGFAILPAELTSKKLVFRPLDVLQKIVIEKENWDSNYEIQSVLHPATHRVWQNHPWMMRRALRLSTDPLLTETGDITDGRDYNTYAMGMDNPSLLEKKYGEIRPFIKEGKIVDEGCSTGSLLMKIAQDFPDSDLIGVEITGEFYSRCIEALRAGFFGETFTHFHQRNVLEKIFQDNSIDTVICNSTTHELFSYGQGEETLREYLQLKYQQLQPGGRLLIRDVVGPSQADKRVYLQCQKDSSSVTSPICCATNKTEFVSQLEELSPYGRFIQFAQDYLQTQRDKGLYDESSRVQFERVQNPNLGEVFALSLKDAYEFITKYMYTDNWKSEMQEQFGFWDLSKWRSEVENIGFTILEGTRAYSSDWTKEHHWKNKVALYDSKTSEQLSYPVTNMALVAQK